MRIRRGLLTGLLLAVLAWSGVTLGVSEASEDRVRWIVSAGGAYVGLNDLQKGLEGWNAIWQRKGHSIIEGGFRPFQWGVHFGAEIAFHLGGPWWLGFETGFLSAGGESRRKVKVEDSVISERLTQNLDLFARAIPLIVSGIVYGPLGRRVEYHAGFGAGAYWGRMDWSYDSQSTEFGTRACVRWRGEALAPALQVRTGLSWRLGDGIWLSAEAVGRMASLRGLRGRLIENDDTTENAVFWYDEGIGYHEISFRALPPAGGDIREGRLELSGVSLRIGLSFRLR